MTDDATTTPDPGEEERILRIAAQFVHYSDEFSDLSDVSHDLLMSLFAHTDENGVARLDQGDILMATVRAVLKLDREVADLRRRLDEAQR